jgi:hypothetical protein
MLTYFDLRLPAWKSLNAVERATLIEIKQRYTGYNNGLIPCSVREIASARGIGKSTAARAFHILQDRGYIAPEIKSSFDWKATGEEEPHGRSTRWRLTEFRNDVTGELPTKEYRTWSVPVAGQESQNAVPSEGQTVPQTGHCVPLAGQSHLEKVQNVPVAGHSNQKRTTQRTFGGTVYNIPSPEQSAAASPRIESHNHVREQSAPPKIARASTQTLSHHKRQPRTGVKL